MSEKKIRYLLRQNRMKDEPCYQKWHAEAEIERIQKEEIQEQEQEDRIRKQKDQIKKQEIREEQVRQRKHFSSNESSRK